MAGAQPHAWFAGFAPAENPQVAVVVLVENAGSGGSVAAPIAKQVIAGGSRAVMEANTVVFPVHSAVRSASKGAGGR